MAKPESCVSQEVSELESAVLTALVRRFDGGVTEGHFHALIYVGQKLKCMEGRYGFEFQHLLPFSEDLDLKIAMLLWNNALCIRDNRIRVSPRCPANSPSPASLDKLAGLSYDALKFLAVLLHLERDCLKSRQEALAAAMRTIPIREDQAKMMILRFEL